MKVNVSQEKCYDTWHVQSGMPPWALDYFISPENLQVRHSLAPEVAATFSCEKCHSTIESGWLNLPFPSIHGATVVCPQCKQGYWLKVEEKEEQ